MPPTRRAGPLLSSVLPLPALKAFVPRPIREGLETLCLWGGGGGAHGTLRAHGAWRWGCVLPLEVWGLPLSGPGSPLCTRHRPGCSRPGRPHPVAVGCRIAVCLSSPRPSLPQDVLGDCVTLPVPADISPGSGEAEALGTLTRDGGRAAEYHPGRCHGAGGAGRAGPGAAEGGFSSLTRGDRAGRWLSVQLLQRPVPPAPGCAGTATSGARGPT